MFTDEKIKQLAAEYLTTAEEMHARVYEDTVTRFLAWFDSEITRAAYEGGGLGDTRSCVIEDLADEAHAFDEAKYMPDVLAALHAAGYITEYEPGDGRTSGRLTIKW